MSLIGGKYFFAKSTGKDHESLLMVGSADPSSRDPHNNIYNCYGIVQCCEGAGIP
jgi:hypothetical protein